MSKTWILGGVAVLAIAVGTYLLVAPEETKAPGSVSGDEQVLSYSSSELGFEFDYSTGEEGFVLDERPLADPHPNARANIVLWHADDYDQVLNPPVGGEGPPSITIRVFKNPERQFPRQWAEANAHYSNINLAMGDIGEAVVGGANAIRYAADGLYPANIAVVAHGENVYVFLGSYREQGSTLEQAFQPLLNSVRFIPQSGQE